MKKIAIIGAGISGIIAAKELSKKYDVQIFDKSRGVGGRVTTRYTDKYNFDHGSQFFTVIDERFQSLVDELLKNDILDIWQARFVEIENRKIEARRQWSDKKHIHYVAKPKMNQMPKFLAKDLDFKLQTRIASIVKESDKWLLHDENGNSQGLFDFVITAIPPLQANDVVPDQILYKSKINNYKMLGCYSLMIGFNEPLNINYDAALVKGDDISWISVNSSKPERADNYCLLIHSTNKWAEENIELENPKAQEYLLGVSEKVMGCNLSHHDYINIHKWRYANINQQNDDKFLLDKENNFASIGDWLIRGRIESAFVSAMDLVEEIS